MSSTVAMALSIGRFRRRLAGRVAGWIAPSGWHPRRMSHHEGPADLVLTGGHVHTVDPGRPRAEAVAVRGERIVSVGSVADIAPTIGPRTRVIDLAGRVLVPGFQ